MKSIKRYLIDALPLTAIALVVVTIYPRLFQLDADPLEVSGDRPKVVTVPQNRQLLQSEQWQAIRVSDGDTIAVKSGIRKERIRLCGIDADERASGGKPAQSVYADQAKDYLQQLINQSNNKVAITMIEKDRYGRWVGEVWVNPGTNKEELANGLLVFKGFARTYPDFLEQCPNAEVLRQAEADAKVKKAGVWSDRYSIPPWEFRKQQRQNRGN